MTSKTTLYNLIKKNAAHIARLSSENWHNPEEQQKLIAFYTEYGRELIDEYKQRGGKRTV